MESFYENFRNSTFNSEPVRYFSDIYESCRAGFINEIGHIAHFYSRIKINYCSLHCFYGDNLLIDYACLYPAEPKNLIILTSGVHGIEGFTGSAVQRMFIREIIQKIDTRKTGCLIIHGINPWGMKHFRRVTVNNVDLNRNFDTSIKLFTKFNCGYAKLNKLLNPNSKVNKTNAHFGYFILAAIFNLINCKKNLLRQAMLEGQYSFPKGIYFGGNSFECQKDILQKLIIEKVKNYEKILFIDLHTGYGPWGKLQIFGTKTKNKSYKDYISSVFKNQKIDWPEDKKFFSNKGDLCVLVSDIVKDKVLIPVCFEYGTMKNDTVFGLLKSLHTVILENQGFHNGYTDNRLKRRVKKLYRELFYPSSAEWKQKIIEQSRNVLSDSCGNLELLF